VIISPLKRFFVRNLVSVRPYRKRGLPLNLLERGDEIDVMHVLKSGIAAGQAEIFLSNSDIVKMTSCAVNESKNVASFLFRRSDPGASAPFFEDPKSRALRKSNKQPDEAVAVSAHLFVSLEPLTGAALPTYRAIREEIPTLGKSYLESLMQHLLREHTYNYTDRNGEVKETHSIIEITGVKSRNLSDALKDSSIQQVVLSRMGSLGGLDSDGLICPREETFRLHVKASPDNVSLTFARIRSFAKVNNWDDVVVRVKFPENRSRNVALDRDADAAEAFFVRAEQIDVRTPLEVCTDTINEELLDHAVQLLKDDNWN
jgi:hypothetical protein